MNNITYAAFLPPLPSPSLNRTVNPTHQLATILSDSWPLFSVILPIVLLQSFFSIFYYPNDKTVF